ncbi:MAG: nucleoside phosphorylase [Chloroflexi bacterium]|nr:nucleoside phosphorylase [Chloroflexota bacterium]
MDTFPITEFDPAPSAIINPVRPEVSRPAPPRAVLCFFADVIQAMLREGRLVEIGAIGSEMGRHPLYVLEAETPAGPQEVLVAHPGVGAPLAAGILEEIIALGVNCFIACGGCGALRPELTVGHPVVLTAAVRDEGTSYHYLPPGREAYPSPEAVRALEAACRAMGIEYRLGKSWTTDGFYRETPARRIRRMSEGCEVVEMEAAAFFAVAQFRSVAFGQIVYSGDLVVPEGWDLRAWNDRQDDRLLMFRLAVDAVLRME